MKKNIIIGMVSAAVVLAGYVVIQFKVSPSSEQWDGGIAESTVVSAELRAEEESLLNGAPSEVDRATKALFAPYPLNTRAVALSEVPRRGRRRGRSYEVMFWCVVPALTL